MILLISFAPINGSIGRLKTRQESSLLVPKFQTTSKLLFMKALILFSGME